MQYRKARLDEVQEVAQVCADAFEDYPYLSMIASNLRKGIGSRFLLEGVEPFVRSTGGHSLGLITNRDYNVPFYEKNGYKQCGYKALTYETHKLGNWPFVKSLDE